MPVDHPKYLLRLPGALDRHQRMVAKSGPPDSPGQESGTSRPYRLNKALVRTVPDPGERHRRRQQRHRQDPHGPWAGPGPASAGCLWVSPPPPAWYELMEARDERRLLNLQRQLARLNLLIIDELGFVSRTGAELLFDPVFSQRWSGAPSWCFDEWTEVFGSYAAGGPHPGDCSSAAGKPPVPSSGRSRKNRAHRQRCRHSSSFKVSTPTNLLPSVITPVVHDHAAPVAQYLGAIDTWRNSSGAGQNSA